MRSHAFLSGAQASLIGKQKFQQNYSISSNNTLHYYNNYTAQESCLYVGPSIASTELRK